MTREDIQLWNEFKYPVTIVQDRYSGTYSGGFWLAFPFDHGEVDEDVCGEDIPCMSFWDNYRDPVGRGNTPDDAFKDLVEQMRLSGLDDIEEAIHRGFLCAGMQNVPVGIIKDTANEIKSIINRQL